MLKNISYLLSGTPNATRGVRQVLAEEMASFREKYFYL